MLTENAVNGSKGLRGKGADKVDKEKSVIITAGEII